MGRLHPFGVFLVSVIVLLLNQYMESGDAEPILTGSKENMTYYLYCTHESSAVLPNWRVNGSTPTDLTNSPLNSYGGRVEDSLSNRTLTVVSIKVDPEIRWLRVACEAGDELSEPWTITLKDDIQLMEPELKPPNRNGTSSQYGMPNLSHVYTYMPKCNYITAGWLALIPIVVLIVIVFVVIGVIIYNHCKCQAQEDVSTPIEEENKSTQKAELCGTSSNTRPDRNRVSMRSRADHVNIEVQGTTETPLSKEPFYEPSVEASTEAEGRHSISVQESKNGTISCYAGSGMPPVTDTAVNIN